MSVRRGSRGERRVGAGLAALLALALAALWFTKGRYDPAFYAPPTPPASDVTAAPAGGDDLVASSPPGFTPAGPAERFGAATLFEKINGKADLYLSAGFHELRCQRFAGGSPGGGGFEACVYRMEGPDAAYSVFSRQRRPGDAEEGLGPHSVVTTNALFVAHGPGYLEVVSGDEGAPSRDGRLAFARAWVAAGGPHAAVATEAPFPAAGQVGGSARLLKDSVFGFAQLDDVHTVDYEDGGELATAFWSRRASPGEARELAGALVAFLRANGAVEAAPLVAEAATLDVLGALEVVCARGDVLAGVHQAEGPALALRLARALCAGGTP